MKSLPAPSAGERFAMVRLARSLIRGLRRLSADRTGGTTIMLALSLPLVVGALGVGVDTGVWYMEKRSLQQMADAAALGGARAMADGLTSRSSPRAWRWRPSPPR